MPVICRNSILLHIPARLLVAPVGDHPSAEQTQELIATNQQIKDSTFQRDDTAVLLKCGFTFQSPFFAALGFDPKQPITPVFAAPYFWHGERNVPIGFPCGPSR